MSVRVFQLVKAIKALGITCLDILAVVDKLASLKYHVTKYPLAYRV